MLLAAPALAQRPVISDDFERPGGELVRALADHKRLELAKAMGVDGSRALEATYQGNSRGSERIVKDVRLKRPGKEFTLCFDVKFADDFDFARGGKLLGLGPEKPVAGGDPIRPDGWSARLMWKRDGEIISYIYHQDQKGRYGDSKKAKSRVGRGKYHAMTLQVTVNSGAEEADGRVAIYIDGETQVEHRALRLRGVDGKEALIAKFMFSTFHGGSSPDWAPRDEKGDYSVEKAWFDNIEVYPGRVIRHQPGAEAKADE